MRLLFVVNDASYFLSHRLPIGLEAQRQGFEVHVAAPGPPPAELESRGFLYHQVHLPRGGAYPVAAILSIGSLVRLFARVKPDLVHAVTTRPVVLGGIAARLARVPAVVFAVAGLGPGIKGSSASPLMRAVLRRLYRSALGHPNARVIVQNRDDRDYLVTEAGLDPNRAHLIRGSGVDLADYPVQPEPRPPLVVLMASRLVRDKGPETFVAAVRLLRERGDAATRFRLAGAPDPHSPGAISLATLDQWTSEGVVEVLGRRDDVPNLIAAANLVVLPSVYGEGLPKILVEAAASGRAVVTTDYPGCRDAIIAGESGLLVPGNDPQALADAMQRLLADNDLRRRFGAAGRRLAETEFGIEGIVAQHIGVYRELLAQSASAREGT